MTIQLTRSSRFGLPVIAMALYVGACGVHEISETETLDEVTLGLDAIGMGGSTSSSISASSSSGGAGGVYGTTSSSASSGAGGAEPDCEDPEVSCAQFCAVIFAKYQLQVQMCDDFAYCCYNEWCSITELQNYYNRQFFNLALAYPCVGGFNIIPSCWLAEDGFCPPNPPVFSHPEACFDFCLGPVASDAGVKVAQ